MAGCFKEGARRFAYAPCEAEQQQSFRADARVTFFGAKKVTKENTQVQFETAN